MRVSLCIANTRPRRCAHHLKPSFSCAWTVRRSHVRSFCVIVAQANALSEFSAATFKSYRNPLECRRQSDYTTFQSNSGLPHSCPVSEKASGGTPETCAGAPAAANSRASVLVP